MLVVLFVVIFSKANFKFMNRELLWHGYAVSCKGLIVECEFLLLSILMKFYEIIVLSPIHSFMWCYLLTAGQQSWLSIKSGFLHLSHILLMIFCWSTPLISSIHILLGLPRCLLPSTFPSSNNVCKELLRIM